MLVLNVGGGASRALPPAFNGWDQHLLDIDPEVKPDICIDAKKMSTLRANRYDAVYCSHNLEHFYRHDVPTVLAGFVHVLRPQGFAYIAVPDIERLMKDLIEGKKDLMDTWYRCPAPISFHDVLYGWNAVMEEGNEYYAHKCGFTQKSITKALRESGFKSVYVASDGNSLHAYAFKGRPTEALRKSLGL
jgi:predicted SAM-dependent methyltransferase